MYSILDWILITFQKKKKDLGGRQDLPAPIASIANLVSLYNNI